MANSLLTIDMITREAVRLFTNSNMFIQNLDRQYDNSFANDGAKIGSTLRIRLPNDYTVNTGPAMSLQDTTEQNTTLTVNNQKNVAVPFTTAERTMSLDDYAERILSPMINNLGGDVAASIMIDAAKACANFVSNVDLAGSAGVAAAGNIISPVMETFLNANAVLTENSADGMDRNIVLGPVTNARSVSALAGLLNPSQEISAQFRSGQMKSGLGYRRWFEDATAVNHTAGTFSAGGTVAGGDQSGSAITVNAITGTLRAGDIVTFAGVFAVNRVTKQPMGTLRQFVVTANVVTTGTSIPIYPALTPGITDATKEYGYQTVQYQTVTASPANGAAMVLATKAGETYRKSIAYVTKAITMATADLVMPKKAVEECSRAVFDGISMRILTDYITGTDVLATRVDVLYGSKTTRGEWCTAVADKV